jgi:hypothetical protein
MCMVDGATPADRRCIIAAFDVEHVGNMLRASFLATVTLYVAFASSAADSVALKAYFEVSSTVCTLQHALTVQ